MNSFLSPFFPEMKGISVINCYGFSIYFYELLGNEADASGHGEHEPGQGEAEEGDGGPTEAS